MDNPHNGVPALVITPDNGQTWPGARSTPLVVWPLKFNYTLLRLLLECNVATSACLGSGRSIRAWWEGRKGGGTICNVAACSAEPHQREIFGRIYIVRPECGDGPTMPFDGNGDNK